jgi:lipoprotein-anchoring transpeptidase ErfK/SrfK
MKGGFAIHSTMYARDEDLPLHETDSRLGDNISTSCIRVDLKVAKYIYNTMPEMTPLMVY